MIELLPITFVGISLIVLMAGFVQSLTGFGFAIISVPFLIILLEPKEAVQISLILGLVLCIALLLTNIKQIETKLGVPLLLGGLVGITLGSSLISNVDPLALRMLVGLSGAILGILILRGMILQVQHESFSSVIIGFVSGALNSTTSYGGVPVALYLTSKGSDKISLRTNMLTYLLLINLVTLLIMFASGLLLANTVSLSLKLVPALLVGIGFGEWVFPKINSQQFTRVVLVVVLLASAMAFFSAIFSYFQIWGFF